MENSKKKYSKSNAYSEEKISVRYFESLWMGEKYSKNRIPGIYRSGTNEEGEDYKILVKRFYNYVFELISEKISEIKKEDLAESYTLWIDDIDEIIRINEGTIRIDGETIILDPKTYLAKLDEEKDISTFDGLVKHYHDINTGKKNRTTKKHAGAMLKQLAAEKPLRELYKQNPVEYNNFLKTSISLIEISDFSSSFQNSITGVLEKAIKLGELMLVGDVETIKKNGDYKDAIKIKGNAQSVLESHWQNYIFSFKDLIFFDHVQLLQEMEVEDNEKNKRYDFFMIDQYGYPVIVELKKSNVRILVKDENHNKNTFSSDVSKSISQLMGYMNAYIGNYDQIDNKILSKLGINLNGNKSISGILIIGGSPINEDQDLSKLSSTTKEVWTQNNYLHNIRVITYKDIIDSLIFKLYSFKNNRRDEEE